MITFRTRGRFKEVEERISLHLQFTTIYNTTLKNKCKYTIMTEQNKAYRLGQELSGVASLLGLLLDDLAGNILSLVPIDFITKYSQLKINQWKTEKHENALETNELSYPTALTTEGPSNSKGSSASGFIWSVYCFLRTVLEKNGLGAKWK